MVSPLHRDGTARRGAAFCGEKVREEARRRKEQTCSAGQGGRARLVVLAATVGGRWSQETAQFSRGLALFTSEGTPELLRGCIGGGTFSRVASQRLLHSVPLRDRAGCTPPSVDEVVREARYAS